MGNEVTKAYKGFDRDLRCHRFQFQVGGTYSLPEGAEVDLSRRGFHACIEPRQVYWYRDLTTSRFAEVELSGVLEHGDTQVVSSTIRIVRELSLVEMIDVQAARDQPLQVSKSTSNFRGVVATQFRNDAVQCSGVEGVALATNTHGAASVSKPHSVAAALGYDGLVRGALGCALLLVERDPYNRPLHALGVIVDGVAVKADTWYWLKQGKLTEVADTRGSPWFAKQQ